MYIHKYRKYGNIYIYIYDNILYQDGTNKLSIKVYKRLILTYENVYVHIYQLHVQSLTNHQLIAF